jgi:hypothetical protein
VSNDPICSGAFPTFGADREFRTDVGRHSVPYSDILSEGPPKDGIPAIDNPKSITVEEVERKHEALLVASSDT